MNEKNSKIYYTEIGDYKYTLKFDFSFPIGITGYDIETAHIVLDKDGLLTIKKGFKWDGATVVIDTKNIMRGALIHDALYRMIRLKLLPYKFRKIADKILRSVCVLDKAPRWRAWYIYIGVRKGAWWAAEPGTQEPEKVLSAP